MVAALRVREGVAEGCLSNKCETQGMKSLRFSVRLPLATKNAGSMYTLPFISSQPPGSASTSPPQPLGLNPSLRAIPILSVSVSVSLSLGLRLSLGLSLSLSLSLSISLDFNL